MKYKLFSYLYYNSPFHKANLRCNIEYLGFPLSLSPSALQVLFIPHILTFNCLAVLLYSEIIFFVLFGTFGVFLSVLFGSYKNNIEYSSPDTTMDWKDKKCVLIFMWLGHRFLIKKPKKMAKEVEDI